MYTHPDNAASLARDRQRDMRASIGSHRLARLLEDAAVPEMKETAMRKVLPYALALPLIIACTAAICSCSSNSSSAVRPTVHPVTTTATGHADPPSPINTSAAPAAGLLAYVPAGLQSSCTDTGTVGHFPATISGYTDSVTCDTGGGTEADYYHYAATNDMQVAYGTASDAAGLLTPGGCASGGDEYGTWSTGGATIGDISCPGLALRFAMVWDDPSTNILAVVKADNILPSNVYLWWQSNGASIDGSSAGATSS